MTQVEEGSSETQSESPGVSEERFAEMFEENMGQSASEDLGEPQSEDRSEETSHETVDTGDGEAHSEVADNPAPASKGDLSLAEATMWCRRGGLPDHILKSKSEDELLALGQEFSTLKRQDDREYSKRQILETGEGTASEDPDETETDVGASDDGDEGNPEDVVSDEDIAALELELGEDAARLVIESRRESAELKRKLDSMESRIQKTDAERQAALVQGQVDSALDGLGESFPTLSKSEETRQKVIDRAAQLVTADPSRYEALEGPERLKVVLKEAALLEVGPPAAPRQTRVIAKGPDTTATGTVDAEKGRGEIGRRAFDRLYRKHM